MGSEPNSPATCRCLEFSLSIFTQTWEFLISFENCPNGTAQLGIYMKAKEDYGLDETKVSRQTEILPLPPTGAQPESREEGWVSMPPVCRLWVPASSRRRSVPFWCPTLGTL